MLMKAFLKTMFKAYPLTIVTLAAIFYLSFFTPPEIPELEDVRFIDKWTHLVMYAGLTSVVLYEHFKQHGLKGLRLKTLETTTLCWRHIRLIALWLPALLGGVIEVLQEHCTNHRRSGDVLDFLADALGSVLAFTIIYLLALRIRK